MFTDHVRLTLNGGAGGNGIVAWRREKYIPKGGPFGGNGGPGGSVIFQADENVFALDCYRNDRFFSAPKGKDGGVNCRQGAAGKDLVLTVPVGTLIRVAGTAQTLCDLQKSGERWIACQGGRGGLGNAFFKHSRNQAPTFSTPGKRGESLVVELELKLLADVGLVGLPNAGKSTFLKNVTAAQPKVGAYPFTTLHPFLGSLTDETYRSLFIADIPGIIGGASQNRGLGLSFLRHIERTAALLFVLDCSGIEGHTAVEDFLVLQEELREYNQDLLEKPFLIALNKMDLWESQEHVNAFKARFPELWGKVFLISAQQPQTLRDITKALFALVWESKKKPQTAPLQLSSQESLEEQLVWE